MAQAGVISASLDVAKNTRADQMVFGDKSLSKLAEDSKDDASGGSSESTPITPKDFFWDQVVVYLVSAILALGFLNISIEFFRGSQVQCFNPNDSSRQQDSYVNDFCYGSLPDSQYYLIFILISAVLIIAPHYLWDSYFTAHFNFFFDLVKKLSRLRDSRTGNYNRNNFEIVKKLEEKFKGKHIGIFQLYVAKLCMQLSFALGVLFADAFYFKVGDFKESFFCPSNVSELNATQPVPLWHFDQPMACVYNSLRLLSFIHKASFILVVAAVVVLFGGLCWTFLRHTTELGATKIAKFCDQSCLPPEVYTFPSLTKVIMSIVTCGRSNKHLRDEHTNTEGGKKENRTCMAAMWSGLKPAFFPVIRSDLDFLLLRLFRADSGHGHVFKDIQVYKELQQKFSEDHQQLFLLNRVHLDWLDRALDQMSERRKSGRKDTDSAAESQLDVTRADKTWERFADMHKYFYESGLKNIGHNPEETVYTFFKPDMGVNPGEWTNSPLRSVLYGLLQFAPNNNLAIDVSFGTSSGYSLVLARAFIEVATIHFNHFYHNLTEVCRKDVYQTNLKTFTLMDDIFSQNTHNILKSEELITELFSTREDGGIDLIVIGPMTDRTKIITTNLLIEKLYSPKFFSKSAVLMAIRPLMVGSRSRMSHFVQFSPPEGLFSDMSEEVEAKLHDAGVHLFEVSHKGKVTHIPNPKKSGTLDNNGTHPSHSATALLSQESSPTTNETSPATNETSPATNETSPATNETSQATNETSSATNETSPATNEISHVTNNTSPATNENPPTTNQTSTNKTPPKPAKGMVVECSGVECIFEFRLFRYKGSKYAPSLKELNEMRRKYEAAEELERTNQLLSDTEQCSEKDSVSNGAPIPSPPPSTLAIRVAEVMPGIPLSPTLGSLPSSLNQNDVADSNRSSVASNGDEPDHSILDSSGEVKDTVSDLPPTDNHRQLGRFVSTDSESSGYGYPSYARGESQQPLLEEDRD